MKKTFGKHLLPFPKTLRHAASTEQKGQIDLIACFVCQIYIVALKGKNTQLIS